MQQTNPLGCYRKEDVIQVLIGIPIVATVAVLLANFVTSFAGI